jgi:hypothetical protein
MIHDRNVRIKAAYAAEDEPGSLSITRRYAAHPIFLLKADGLFASGALSPK